MSETVGDGVPIVAMWLCWAVYWALASRAVKATARRESMCSRLLHVLPLGVAAVLLGTTLGRVGWLRLRFVEATRWPLWAGTALVAAGLLFTVWARVHLGRNWSAIVTLKRGHELVTSGPYAIVRHPIYSGLLLAFAGSALACGEWRGVLALLIVAGSLWRKLRLEERWMGEQFGAAYARYRERVPAIVPFLA